MKLSAAQQKVLDEAKKQVDTARSCSTYEDYVYATCSNLSNDFKDRLIFDGTLATYWEDRVSGIVRVHCNSKTLRSLQANGLIEVLRDSTGEAVGIDTIKLVNY